MTLDPDLVPAAAAARPPAPRPAGRRRARGLPQAAPRPAVGRHLEGRGRGRAGPRLHGRDPACGPHPVVADDHVRR
ncbi:hypothetical protein ACU686_07240 [Yinghuangia aomiensis]